VARGWPRAEDKLTSPTGLYDEIADRIMTPEEVGFEQAQPFMNVTREQFEELSRRPFERHSIGTEFKYFYSMFQTNRRVALYLMEKSRRELSQPSDMLLLVRLVDMACHTSLKHSELVEDHIDAEGEDLRRYAGVVSEAYRSVDRLLGELLDSFGAGNVVVVSDHGFELVYHWPDWWRSYDHGNAPDGIFLASGPAFGKGRVEGSVDLRRDAAARLPEGPPDRPGSSRSPPEEVLSPRLVAERDPLLMESHGERARTAGAAGESGEVNREVLDRLRALGYVD